MKLIIKLWIGFLLASSAYADAPGEDTKVDLSSTHAEFVNDQGQKIIFFGFFHMGPSAYYTRMSDLINNTARSVKNPVIADEFFTCDEDVYTVADTGAFDWELWSRNTENGLLNMSKSDVLKLEKDGFLKKRSCELDKYNNRFRPPQLVYRNISQCQLFKENGAGCQFEDLKMDEQIPRVSIDLHLDDEPPFAQVFASLFMYPSREPKVYKEVFTLWYNDYYDMIKKQIFEFIVDYRDDNLVTKSLELLKKHDTVILPWGEAHYKGVKRLLLKNGFRLSSKGEMKVHYMSDKEADTFSELRRIYDLYTSGDLEF